VFLVILLALWQWICVSAHINPIIVPSPLEVGKAFVQNPRRLFSECGITMLEAAGGFVLGSITAYVLAASFVFSRTLRDAIYPYAVALKSTPLIALAPLLVLWFGNGMLSKIIMSGLVAFFPVLVNSITGLTAIDREIFDLMKSLSASKWQILTKIRVPNSIAYVFPALKIATSLAVVGAVIGEFTGATQGIGHLINTSSYYLETSLMFAAVVAISVAGIIFFGLVAFVERKVVFWSDSRLE
jgi:NitT/TauT family transport system permease protein